MNLKVLSNLFNTLILMSRNQSPDTKFVLFHSTCSIIADLLQTQYLTVLHRIIIVDKKADRINIGQ